VSLAATLYPEGLAKHCPANAMPPALPCPDRLGNVRFRDTRQRRIVDIRHRSCRVGLRTPVESGNILRMKRTNLVLDEQLLEEATRLSGEKTYSAAVMRALEVFVRRVKARQILDLRGSGLWEGDLGAMRRDRTRKKRAS